MSKVLSISLVFCVAIMVSCGSKTQVENTLPVKDEFPIFNTGTLYSFERNQDSIRVQTGTVEYKDGSIENWV